MATEKLKFKIELYSTYWDQPPQVEIKVNELKDQNDSKNYFDSKTNKPIISLDPSYYKGQIVGSKKNPDTIEFEHFFEENKKYELVLFRTGKNKNQTKIDKNNVIIKDQLLHIKSIEIDDIDLGNLLFEGKYIPDYPEPWYSQQKSDNKTPPAILKNSTSLGHNGSWIIEFSTPFYMWLLENLY